MIGYLIKAKIYHRLERTISIPDRVSPDEQIFDKELSFLSFYNL